MDVVTIDFETYYDTDYSLSKMTTEEYVRDPRFEIIGVGVKINNQPATWYAGSEPAKFLRSLDYSKMAILAHNTVFDGAILSWHMGIKPRLWLDTLSMARPRFKVVAGGLSLAKLVSYFGVGEKGDEVIRALGKRRRDFTAAEIDAYGAYCLNDVDLTYGLFKQLAKGFPADELRIIDMTLRMYTEPQVELDAATLTDHLAGVRAAQSRLLLDLGKVHDLGGTEEEVRAALMSNVKLSEVLQGLEVSVPMKTSPTTNKLTYAFSKKDAEFVSMAEHRDERVAAVVAARLGVKSTIEETRTERLLSVAERGRLPIMLNYYGAHTGRFSGGDKLNLQNLPRGGALRRSLRAPEGYTFIAADSSQIEARTVAWLAGQTDLVRAFAQGRDVYCEFASEVFKRPITKADPVERFVGKTCILGLGYGMGAIKFRDTLAIGQGGVSAQFSESEATRVVHLYRNRYHKIEAFWNRCRHALEQMVSGNPGMVLSDALPSLVTSHDRIEMPNGLPIMYPFLHQDASAVGRSLVYLDDPRQVSAIMAARLAGEQYPSDKLARIYGGKMVENITQSVARSIVSWQALRIAQNPICRVAFQVHDENVVLAPTDKLDEATEWVRECMSSAPSWAAGLPVACSIGTGTNYGECK